MNVRGAVLLVIIFLAASAASQEPKAEPPTGSSPKTEPSTVAPPEELAIDQVKKTVVFLNTSYVEDNQMRRWNGTGFLIFVTDPRIQGKGIVWLVTNKHMLHPPNRPYFDQVVIRFNRRNAGADGSHVSEAALPVIDGAGNLQWFVDTDESVDLALFRITPDPKSLDAAWFPTESFATRDTFKKLRINETDEVLFAGLFASYFGSKRNFPIVRHGKIALVTDERIPINAHDPTKTEEIILVEVTSFGGNSGSPVFLRIGGVREAGGATLGYSYYLLGVMQGFFSEGSDVSFDVTATVRGQISQNSGIAAVIPSDAILKILSSPRAKAVTDAVVARTLTEQGKYVAAEELYKQSIQESETAVGKMHPDLVQSLRSYAEMLRLAGKQPDAAAVDRRAQGIEEVLTKKAAGPEALAIVHTCLPSDCAKEIREGPEQKR